MKKRKVILFLTVGFLLGIAAAAGAYLLSKGEVDWQSYIENTLAPYVVAASASVGTLYIGAIPVINLVKGAAGKFHTATEKVTKTVENNEQNEKVLTEYDERISAFENRFDLLDEKLLSVINLSEDARKMLLIGFCNMDELVKKGYAAEIGKVNKNGKTAKP